MSSISEQASTPEEERLSRKRQPEQAAPAMVPPADMVGMLRQLQRTAGNQAVNALLQRTAAHQPAGAARNRSSLLQRDPDTDPMGQGAAQDGGATDQTAAQAPDAGSGATGEQTVALPAPAPVTLEVEEASEPGDYEVPSNGGTMMAKHVGVPLLQRDGGDGGQPSNSASVQNTTTLAGPRQAPWQMQVTRTLHLLPPLSLDALHIDFFQDPQVSIGLDSQGTLSAQVAQNLFTVHFLPNWRAPIDASLAAIYQQNILPSLGSPQYGGQAQAEAHVTKTFSVTFGLQGMRTDSEDGKSRVWSVTGAAGVITYF